MVRIAAEQLPDTLRFPVGQTEGAVQRRLGGQLRQVIQCNRGSRRNLTPTRPRCVSPGRCAGRLVMLAVLALIWGASFMLIKIADRQLAPSTLFSAASARPRFCSPRSRSRASASAGRSPRLRAAWRWLVVVALVNTALPFWLLSWGETRIDSGLASIIQGAVPIFNALARVRVLP